MIYWFHLFADLSSLLRDGTVIEEDERRGSSSESSACLVGTTTQGLESTPPPKGNVRSDFNMTGRPFVQDLSEIVLNFSVITFV